LPGALSCARNGRFQEWPPACKKAVKVLLNTNPSPALKRAAYTSLTSARTAPASVAAVVNGAYN
jgi:hypothetical protein